MAKANVGDFLRQLTTTIDVESALAHGDRQLVEQFLASRDEAAFLALLRRHGAMVYRVCWRVLQRAEDAEDAFQTTFLVLAQKLQTIRKRESLASWLHGVALRVALKARTTADRRRRHRPEATVPATPPDDITWKELRAILDAELGQLPERWRLPLILCYLEDCTQDEAAHRLGWSKNTFRRRLEAGRAGLGRRLRRRGVVWPAAFSAALLSDSLGTAAPATKHIASIVHAATALVAGREVAPGLISARVAAQTHGVLRTMMLKKLKVAITVALVFVLAVIGAGGLVYQALHASPPDETRLDQLPADPPKPDPDKKQPDQPKPAVVQVVQPKTEVLKFTSLAPSTLASSESIAIVPQATGLLSQLHVDIGDKVKKGQVLARIDAPELTADVKQAQIAVESAHARLDQQRAQIEIAKADVKVADAAVAQREQELAAAKNAVDMQKKELARWQKLVANKAATQEDVDVQLGRVQVAVGQVAASKAAVDGAQAQKTQKQGHLHLAQAGLKVEELQLVAAKTGLEKAQAIADYAVITAPFDGVVTQRNINVGAQVSAKNPVAILTIVRNDPVRLIVPVAENDAPFVQVGSLVDLEAKALGQKLIGLKVSRISPVIDLKTGTMHVEVDVPNPKGQILPGMSAKAKVHLSKQAMMIPKSCLSKLAFGLGGMVCGSVFVIRDGKASEVPIEGILRDDRVEVLSGLSPEDQIITNPEGLKDGAPVTIKKGAP